MFLIATVTYPLTSVLDAAKVFADNIDRERPAYLKSMGPYICYGGEGIKSVTIYEVEKGHEEEGLKDITGYFVQYHNVEGFKLIVEPAYTGAEALMFVQE